MKNNVILKNIINNKTGEIFRNISNSKLIRNDLAVFSYLKKLIDAYAPKETQIDYFPYNYSNLHKTTLAHAIMFSQKEPGAFKDVPKKIEYAPSFLNSIIYSDSKEEQTIDLLNLIKTTFHESAHLTDYENTKKNINNHSLKLALSFLSSSTFPTEKFDYYSENYNSVYLETSAELIANAELNGLIKNNILPLIKPTKENNKIIKILKNQLEKTKFEVAINALKMLNPTNLNELENENLRDLNDSKRAKIIIEKHPDLINKFPVLKLKYNEYGEELTLKELLKNKQNSKNNPSTNLLYSTLIFQKVGCDLNSGIDFKKEDLSTEENLQILNCLNSYKANFIFENKSYSKITQNITESFIENLNETFPNDKSFTYEFYNSKLQGDKSEYQLNLIDKVILDYKNNINNSEMLK